MMRLRLIVVLVAFAGSGCQSGQHLGEYAPARQAEGIRVTMRLAGGQKIGGELLAVEDTALVVRTEDELLRVPFRLQRGIDPSPLQPPARADRPPADFLTRMRLHSRFPGGITPAIERALLEGYRRERITLVTS